MMRWQAPLWKRAISYLGAVWVVIVLAAVGLVLFSRGSPPLLAAITFPVVGLAVGAQVFVTQFVRAVHHAEIVGDSVHLSGPVLDRTVPAAEIRRMGFSRIAAQQLFIKPADQWPVFFPAFDRAASGILGELARHNPDIEKVGSPY